METFYFISSRGDLDKKIIIPEIPNNFLTRGKYEEWQTPRIRLYTTISDCLSGLWLGERLDGATLCVYKVMGIRRESLIKPSITSVPYELVLSEWWYLSKLELRYLTTIKVGREIKKEYYHYGPRSTKAFIYRWEWEEELKEKWEKPKLLKKDKKIMSTFRIKRFSQVYLEQKEFGAHKRKQNREAIREAKNAEMHTNRAAKKAAKVQEMANKLNKGTALNAAEVDMMQNGGYAQSVKDVASGKVNVSETQQVAKQINAAQQSAGRAGGTVAKMSKQRKSLANGGQLNLNGGEYQVKYGPNGQRTGGMRVTLADKVKADKPEVKETYAKISGEKVTKAGQQTGNKINIETKLNPQEVQTVQKVKEGVKIKTGRQKKQRGGQKTGKTIKLNEVTNPVVEVVPNNEPATKIVTETSNKVNSVISNGSKGAVQSTPKKTNPSLFNKFSKFAKSKNGKIVLGTAAGLTAAGSLGAYLYHKDKKKEKAYSEKEDDKKITKKDIVGAGIGGALLGGYAGQIPSAIKESKNLARLDKLGTIAEINDNIASKRIRKGLQKVAERNSKVDASKVLNAMKRMDNNQKATARFINRGQKIIEKSARKSGIKGGLIGAGIGGTVLGGIAAKKYYDGKKAEKKDK